MLPAGYTVAMTVIKLYLILTGCTAYSSPEGCHKQCIDSRKANGYNSATAPSTVFQLPITKPYSMSSSSSNLNTPLCGSCRFHGTYLNKRAKTDLKKNKINNNKKKICIQILRRGKLIWRPFAVAWRHTRVKEGRGSTLWECWGHRLSASAGGPPSRLGEHGSNG